MLQHFTHWSTKEQIKKNRKKSPGKELNWQLGSCLGNWMDQHHENTGKHSDVWFGAVVSNVCTLMSAHPPPPAPPWKGAPALALPREGGSAHPCRRALEVALSALGTGWGWHSWDWDPRGLFQPQSCGIVWNTRSRGQSPPGPAVGGSSVLGVCVLGSLRHPSPDRPPPHSLVSAVLTASKQTLDFPLESSHRRLCSSGALFQAPVLSLSHRLVSSRHLPKYLCQQQTPSQNTSQNASQNASASSRHLPKYLCRGMRRSQSCRAAQGRAGLLLSPGPPSCHRLPGAQEGPQGRLSTRTAPGMPGQGWRAPAGLWWPWHRRGPAAGLPSATPGAGQALPTAPARETALAAEKGKSGAGQCE